MSLKEMLNTSRRQLANQLNEVPVTVTYIASLSEEEIAARLKRCNQDIKGPLALLSGSSEAGRRRSDGHGMFLVGLDTERQSLSTLREAGIEPIDWWTEAGLTPTTPNKLQLVTLIQLGALLIDSDGELVYRVMVFSPFKYWSLHPRMKGCLPPVLVRLITKKWTCAGHNIGQDLVSLEASFGLDLSPMRAERKIDTWKLAGQADRPRALKPVWNWLCTGVMDERPPSDAHSWVRITECADPTRVVDIPLEELHTLHRADQRAAVEKMVLDARNSHAIAAVFTGLALISMMSLTPEPDTPAFDTIPPGGEPPATGCRRSPPSPPTRVRPRPLKPGQFRSRSASTGDLTSWVPAWYLVSPGGLFPTMTTRVGPGWFTIDDRSFGDGLPMSSAFTPHDSSPESTPPSWTDRSPYYASPGEMSRSLSSTSSTNTPIEAGC